MRRHHKETLGKHLIGGLLTVWIHVSVSLWPSWWEAGSGQTRALRPTSSDTPPDPSQRLPPVRDRALKAMKWQGPLSFKSAYFSYHSSTLEGGEQAVPACPVITDCSWGSVWWLSKEECDAVWVSANTCQSSSSSGMSHSHTLVSSEYWLMAEDPSLKWLINTKIIPHPPVVFSSVDGLYLLPWEFCQASDRTLYNCTSLGEGCVLPSRKEI